MKKIMFIGVFLILFFNLSFCKSLQMSNGIYIFQSTENELVLFTIINDSLSLTTEDNNTIFLELDIDENGNYFYFYNDQLNNWVIVFFDEICTCVIGTKNDKFLLYNTSKTCQ